MSETRPFTLPAQYRDWNTYNRDRALAEAVAGKFPDEPPEPNKQENHASDSPR